MKKLADKILSVIRPQRRPLKEKDVIRLLVGLLIIASLVAGYFYTRYHDLQRDYQLLEESKIEMMGLPSEK